MTDSEIIALFFRRDETAIAETERAYGGLCRQVSGRILRSREDVEECVNEGYFRLWSRIPPEHPLHLAAFLVKIVRELSIDRLRQVTALRRGGGQLSVALEELRQVAGPEDAESRLAARELGQAIDAFLRGQNQRSRNVFVRRYFYLEARSEIAGRYGISPAQVSVLLSRTRKRLANYLKQEGYL